MENDEMLDGSGGEEEEEEVDADSLFKGGENVWRNIEIPSEYRCFNEYLCRQ